MSTSVEILRAAAICCIAASLEAAEAAVAVAVETASKSRDYFGASSAWVGDLEQVRALLCGVKDAAAVTAGEAFGGMCEAHG